MASTMQWLAQPRIAKSEARDRVVEFQSSMLTDIDPEDDGAFKLFRKELRERVDLRPGRRRGASEEEIEAATRNR